MSKASAPVWASSRKAINLPHCPPDLSEPQYADLLFSKGCYVCFSLLFVVHLLSNMCSFATHLVPSILISPCDSGFAVAAEIDGVHLNPPSYLFHIHINSTRIVYTIHTNGICEDEPETAAKAQKRKEFVCRKYMYLDLVPRFETESTCFAPGCFSVCPHFVSLLCTESRKEHCLFYRPQLLEVRNKERTMTEREWRAYYVAHVDEMTAFMEVSISLYKCASLCSLFLAECNASELLA